jgi:hypothetical protein
LSAWAKLPFRPRSQQDGGVIQTLTTQLNGKQREYEEVLIRIKLSNPEYTSLVSVSPLTLSGVQKLLDHRYAMHL